MFVLDSSSSIGNNFFQVINFVRGVVNQFNIGDSGAQFGVVRFAVEPNLVIPLARFPTKLRLIEQIDNLNTQVDTCSGRCTNTGAGIRVAAEQLNGPNHRPHSKKVMIIVTDGQANFDPQGAALVNFARMVRLASDIEIFAVGFGPATSRPDSQQELNGIASDPDDEHVFTTTGFAQISNFINNISISTCSSKYSTVQCLAMC